jgi:succinyl-diaminopimelate desuccinylase
MSNLEAYLDQHGPRFEDELGQACDWLVDQFRQLGLQSERIETEGPPLALAQSPPVPGKPVVLVYGHYDVQPADFREDDPPDKRWHSPPFQPTRRGGNIYARGATDDKGQLLTHLKSAEAVLRTEGRLPVQLKFLIEGEEEVGSHALHAFLEHQAGRLACDVAVISDTSQFAPGQPAITCGLRGIAYFELEVRGPNRDLHSGSFGGTLTNPANALCRILTALVDDQGRIQVPGFYEDVQPIPAEELRQWQELDFDESRYLQQLGVTALAGEAGYGTLARRWARPTFDVSGLTSGYQQEGAKTVIPAWARAKFSFRLVPRQDPAAISARLRAHLAAICPPGVTIELTDLHGAPAVVVPLDSPYVAAAARAIARSFGHAPVWIREGGSIPVVTAFRQRLKVDTLLLGWGQDDDNPHGPNEKFSLADFHRGIRASAYLWHELGSMVPPAA